MQIIELPTNRPQPPNDGFVQGFSPSPELQDWVTTTFIKKGGPLVNPDHEHLLDAHIGYLWTDVENRKNQRRIIGTAEIPTPQGNKWQKERALQQLKEWFGAVPDFVITFDGLAVIEYDDASFCSVVEHELYHCAHAHDEYDCPKFTKQGNPKFGIRGHDFEEHTGVLLRYGFTATNQAMAEILTRASQAPLVSAPAISAACGVCLNR